VKIFTEDRHKEAMHFAKRITAPGL